MLSSPPPLIHDRYRLVEWLSQGNMGMIYRAHDEALDRQVVIKFIRPEIASAENSARFLREARLVARLSHPNIMAIYDIGQQDGWNYLVLEYIPGRDLYSLTRQNGGRLPVPQGLEMARSVLQALDYAHQQGIIHRDIKPENILVTPDGQVKVADFGLALAGGEARLTQESTVAGTVLYLAPETINGASSEPRTDLYAVGAVLYEVLTGRPPFDGENLLAIISQIVHGSLTAPRQLNPEIPPVLETIILRLMARDPEQRFASAQEALRALPPTIDSLSSDAPASELPASPGLILMATTEGPTAAVEAERRRLADMLHASVIEPLNLLLSQAGAFEQTLAPNPGARMAVSVLASLARQTLQQVHDLESHLHPAVLETLGLEPALEALSEQAVRAYNLHLDLNLERLAGRLAANAELALFRSAQEVLAALHQQHVLQAALQLERREERLVLEIGYSGLEPLPEKLLAEIRQRITPLGGRLDQARSAQGKMRLAMLLPLQSTPQFTPREMDVLQGLVEGLSNKELANRLSVSPRTINYHLDNIFAKLGVRTRTEAALIALRRGLARRPSQT